MAAYHIHLVEPYEMNDATLLGQYRNIPRIITSVRNAYERGDDVGKLAAASYRLGRGTQTFFYTKLEYINRRYGIIVRAMQSRGYRPELTHDLHSFNRDIPDVWWQDWIPSEVDIELSRTYIQQTLAKRGKVAYN